MQPTTTPRIKICCISSREEAMLAILAGASAIGLVAKMPSGPGPIPDELIAEIARMVPPPIDTFLLTSETSATEIIKHQQRVLTNTIQLVDELKTGTYAQIRKALPGIKLVQVIHVIDRSSIAEAIKLSHFVDALLLDSGNPNLAIKELGGTGRTHNWEFSREIRESIAIPLFLAGGLNPGNVREAIEKVHPFGLDFCSGLRTNGKLDPIKLADVFKAITGK
jgi:phosphoribosylanthranilate isomerase